MATAARLHVRPVEEFLPSLGDDAFDVVFRMAVLEHLHDDSASVFADITRVSKRLLVTVEDEREYAWRQFPTKLPQGVRGLGLHQVHEESCRTVPGLGAPFVARVFTR